ncbi:MAG TPA: LLM class F420-dependent oxidoreductase [Candidatus Limnocylindrales bacterium]|nr:LLM class F420-dependent oxidoreductase [Candidatus Limnocylindrales bacterium]
MKIGLQIPSFTFPGGDAAIGRTLGRIVRTADAAGFDSIWVMDHFFQIRSVGPTTDPMLEGWTTLGFLAANTTRARLGLLVGGVHYRAPGLWIKAATTLDVLSGGRAWLGIGAAWNEEESRALGFPFPSLGERFDLVEDTLRMAHLMWQGERGSETSFDGRRTHAERLLNAPQSLSRPRVPILVGGGGERRTLRLAAQYADATNVFGGPEGLAHKYRVLREHCEAIGRRYDEIERTTLQNVAVTPDGGNGTQTPSAIVDRFGELGDAGAQQVIVSIRDVWDPARLEVICADVVPAVHDL